MTSSSSQWWDQKGKEVKGQKWDNSTSSRQAEQKGKGSSKSQEVKAGDWMCECGHHNFAWRDACNKCGAFHKDDLVQLKTPCMFHLMGKCKHGAACKYGHEEVEANEAKGKEKGASKGRRAGLEIRQPPQHLIEDFWGGWEADRREANQRAWQADPKFPQEWEAEAADGSTGGGGRRARDEGGVIRDAGEKRAKMEITPRPPPPPAETARSKQETKKQDSSEAKREEQERETRAKEKERNKEKETTKEKKKKDEESEDEGSPDEEEEERKKRRNKKGQKTDKEQEKKGKHKEKRRSPSASPSSTSSLEVAQVQNAKKPAVKAEEKGDKKKSKKGEGITCAGDQWYDCRVIFANWDEVWEKGIKSKGGNSWCHACWKKAGYEKDKGDRKSVASTRTANKEEDAKSEEDSDEEDEEEQEEIRKYDERKEMIKKAWSQREINSMVQLVEELNQKGTIKTAEERETEGEGEVNEDKKGSESIDEESYADAFYKIMQASEDPDAQVWSPTELEAAIVQLQANLESKTMGALRHAAGQLRAEYQGMFAHVRKMERDFMKERELKWRTCLLRQLKRERKDLNEKWEQEKKDFEKEREEWEKEKREWERQREEWKKGSQHMTEGVQDGPIAQQGAVKMEIDQDEGVTAVEEVGGKKGEETGQIFGEDGRMLD